MGVGTMENEVSEQCKRDLEKSLLSIIYQYVKICKEYAENTGKDANAYQMGLDQRAFRICIFMNLPLELIDSIERIDVLIEEVLWYQFVEMDGESDKIKIAGYLATTTEQVSCFSLYSALLYSHVLDKHSKADRDDFYLIMLVYPCCRKIMELNNEERKECILQYLNIHTENMEELIDDGKITSSFDELAKRFDYGRYMDIEEIRKERSEACEGALGLKNL